MQKKCMEVKPELMEVSDSHKVACHFQNELATEGKLRLI